VKLVYTDEAIEDLKCLIPFEILFSESTSFDTQFTPVPSSFCGYGIAWRVNDSNLTRRGNRMPLPPLYYVKRTGALSVTPH